MKPNPGASAFTLTIAVIAAATMMITANMNQIMY
jgi:hypothetical protein